MMGIVALGVTVMVVISVFGKRNPPPAVDGNGFKGGVIEPQGKLDPPVLRKLEDFRLTERDGQPFAMEELRGNIWIANFIFTRCGGMCPVMTTHMSDVQSELKKHEKWKDMRLVSISVDPDHDTPEILTAYANQWKADPDQWVFLTGTRDEVWKLTKENFLLPVDDAPADAADPIIHSPNFVLVDREGRVRGFFDGMKKDERAKLLGTIEKLLKE